MTTAARVSAYGRSPLAVPVLRRERRARPSRPSPDVAIVGGGIIGCALAAELARRGARVVIAERTQPGAEASSAAAGMLGPRAECDAPGPFLTLGVASLSLYPALVERLREETGIDPEYQRDGILYVALTEADERRLAARARWQRRAGCPVEHLSAREALSLEPAIRDDVRGAIRFPDDHRIDNVRLSRAFAVLASRRGAELRVGVPVRAIRCEHGRAVALETGHERIVAGAIVNAAGAWAAELTPAGRVVPIRPVRGQMATLTASRPPFQHAIYSRGVYLVPRRDGRVLVGSTYEEAGFDKRVTGEALAGILARALRLAPALRGASFGGAWAGLRPGTPDGLPILGADPEIAGLFYATGHYRNGILLAPVTARALAELVLAGRTSYDIAPFAVERFTRRPSRGGEPS
jgi:glycine oxidase